VRYLAEQVAKLFIGLQIIVSDWCRFCGALFHSQASLAAENLFLRKQLILYQEREKKPKATSFADRFVFSKLAHLFDWRSALVIVKPATLIGWHRATFRRLWRWKSRPIGRPSISVEWKRLIGRMAAANPTWGEERIADELFLKLQIRISPRTVGKYMGRLPRTPGSRDQRWATFLRNHAYEIVACDFFVAVTARFRILYIFVALEIGQGVWFTLT
jgi:putative transposase